MNDKLTVRESLSLEHLTDPEQNFVVAVRSLLIMGRDLGQKFRMAITYAREHKLTPEFVRAALRDAGYPEPRISEFRAIAELEPAEYDRFASGELTWKPALELAREKRKGRKHSQVRQSKTTGLYRAFVKLSAKRLPVSGVWANCGFFLALVPFDDGAFDGTLKSPDGVSYLVSVKSGNKNTKKKINEK